MTKARLPRRHDRAGLWRHPGLVAHGPRVVRPLVGVPDPGNRALGGDVPGAVAPWEAAVGVGTRRVIGAADYRATVLDRLELRPHAVRDDQEHAGSDFGHSVVFDDDVGVDVVGGRDRIHCVALAGGIDDAGHGRDVEVLTGAHPVVDERVRPAQLVNADVELLRHRRDSVSVRDRIADDAVGRYSRARDRKRLHDRAEPAQVHLRDLPALVHHERVGIYGRGIETGLEMTTNCRVPRNRDHDHEHDGMREITAKYRQFPATPAVIKGTPTGHQ